MKTISHTTNMKQQNIYHFKVYVYGCLLVWKGFCLQSVNTRLRIGHPHAIYTATCVLQVGLKPPPNDDDNNNNKKTQLDNAPQLSMCK